jgi:hypothetical protein
MQQSAVISPVPVNALTLPTMMAATARRDLLKNMMVGVG